MSVGSGLAGSVGWLRTTPPLSRIVTGPESAPQNTTSLPDLRIPARCSSGARGVPAQRAFPTAPITKGKP